MIGRIRRRGAGAAAPALLLCALALAGCETVPGAAGVGPGPMVEVGGRSIRVTPPEGFCVDETAMRPEGDAAFVLIEDCALLGAGAGVEEGPRVGAPSPRPALVNGLVTLSIGPEPLFRGPPAGRGPDWDGLEAFLRSERGRASAGMGGEADSIRIVETRRADDTLYVLVEDLGERVIPVLGDRFWRGFTEVRDRAVIASLGVFASSPMRDEAKLAHLARVIAALKQGNGDVVGPGERALAAKAAPPAPAPARAAVTLAPAEEAAGPPPGRPAERPTAAPGPEASLLAPAAAPQAPRRPEDRFS